MTSGAMLFLMWSPLVRGHIFHHQLWSVFKLLLHIYMLQFIFLMLLPAMVDIYYILHLNLLLTVF